jgi:hypothetical protein
MVEGEAGAKTAAAVLVGNHFSTFIGTYSKESTAI